jgi:methionyl-tRNA formyltransferase
MPERFRIVFAGTPAFAVPALAALADSRHAVVEVWTQPDRPAGRGRKPQASPIKQQALDRGLDVAQPVNLKQAQIQARLTALAPELMIVAAYGQLLPRALLAAPRYGCLNIHASLLPRWRGAAPIQRAILAGDTMTGVTIMQMETGLDTGAILCQREAPIEPEETAGMLHDRLATLGAAALLTTLDDLVAGTLRARHQDPANATYARKLNKAEAEIDWGLGAAALARQVRAFNPWPMAFTWFAGERLRVLRAQARRCEQSDIPGTVLAAGPEGVDVAAGTGTLRILKLQPAGKRAMPAAEFAHARPVVGSIFGRVNAS